MKSRLLQLISVLTIALLVLNTYAGAGDKKDKKDKPKPMEDVVVNSELIKGDLKDTNLVNSFAKTYTFKMEKGKGYQIELQTQAFRPYLRLTNEKGTQIAAEFDRFNLQTAVIVHRPAKTEDFQIIATSQTANALGKFKLTIKELTGDEGKPITLKFEKGAVAYSGNLDRTDPKYNGQKIHKLFVIELQKGSTYQIDHMAKNFDAYLYLESPEGKVLAQDDDGGEGLNSRITHKAAETGKYRVVATSLGGANIGPFNFQIRQTGGDLPKDDKDKK
jgi:hypothetical protein